MCSQGPRGLSRCVKSDNIKRVHDVSALGKCLWWPLRVLTILQVSPISYFQKNSLSNERDLEYN